MQRNNYIYMDNAATTPLRSEALYEMMPYLTSEFYNASAGYEKAYDCHMVLEECRIRIAKCIGANPSSIYFTSGGTESNNWALKSTALLYQNKGKHIITSQIEHPSVLNTCKFLETQGFEVTYVSCDSYGRINLDELENAIREDTILISIMHANNEVGAINDIKCIGNIAKKHDILFHTDAVQTMGHLKIDVTELGVDMLSASAHKFGGAKGVGFLYSQVPLFPLIHGGSQEDGLRGGTTNLAGIVAMTKALEVTCAKRASDNATRLTLRKYFLQLLEDNFKGVVVNGCLLGDYQLDGILSVSFKNKNSIDMLCVLDGHGICASAGSACATGENEPSHVLKAIGVPDEYINGTLRFSFSENNTSNEIKKVVEVLKNFFDFMGK